MLSETVNVKQKSSLLILRVNFENLPHSEWSRPIQLRTTHACKDGVQQSTHLLLVDMQICTVTVEFIVVIPQKPDILYPAVPLVRDIHKGLYSLLQIFLLIHLHYCSVNNREIWKHLTCLSTDESMVKMWYIKQGKIPQLLKKWNS